MNFRFIQILLFKAQKLFSFSSPNYLGHFYFLKIKIEYFCLFQKNEIKCSCLLCQFIFLKLEKNQLRIQKLDLASQENYKTLPLDIFSCKYCMSLIEELVKCKEYRNFLSIQKLVFIIISKPLGVRKLSEISQHNTAVRF